MAFNTMGRPLDSGKSQSEIMSVAVYPHFFSLAPNRLFPFVCSNSESGRNGGYDILNGRPLNVFCQQVCFVFN